MVRLKDCPVALGLDMAFRFQFHSGSIKREAALFPPFARTISFNSIVVRLKARGQAQDESPARSFNSIVVRLKATSPCVGGVG